jgi:hypothetical protein
MKVLIRLKKAQFLVFLLVLYGCTPLIGPHSPIAYENATSLKADVLTVLDKAKTPYSENKATVEGIQLKAEQAYEFVNGIPHNDLSAKQWKILKKPDGALLGKFFKRWEERGALSDAVIKEYKVLASDAFDEIICLEANKKEATECKTGGE